MLPNPFGGQMPPSFGFTPAQQRYYSVMGKQVMNYHRQQRLDTESAVLNRLKAAGKYEDAELLERAIADRNRNQTSVEYAKAVVKLIAFLTSKHFG